MDFEFQFTLDHTKNVVLVFKKQILDFSPLFQELAVSILFMFLFEVLHPSQQYCSHVEQLPPKLCDFSPSWDECRTQSLL